MSVSLLLLLVSLTGTAGLAGGLVGRRRLVARMRADRVRMVAIATPDFEPSVDALRDMVGAIGRARSWRVPARAQTVRCEFVCSEHKLAVVYEMPARLMRAARLALPDGLQLVDVDFAKRFPGMGSEAVRVGAALSAGAARCEFRIVAGRGHRLPPAPAELDLTRNLGELARRCGEGESVTLMVDVAPLRRSAVKAWRKELVEDSRPASTLSLRGGGSRKPPPRRSSSSGDLIGQVVDDVQDLLTGGAGVGASSEARQGDVVLHRHEGAAVQRALAEPRPVHVQLLAVANSDRGGRDRAGSLLSMLHSAIAPLGSPGEAELVKRTGRKHVARRLRSEDGPLLRPGFDARARSGWMTGEAAVCTMTEIAPLLRPPTRHAKSDAIARTVLVPAPRFPKWNRQRGLLPMGVVIDHEGRKRPAGMPIAEYLFGLSCGRAGYGKTEQLLVQALQLALVERASMFMLDPQRDAIRDMVAYLGAERERLCVVDLTVDGPGEHHVSWNPLSMAGLGPEHLTARANAMTDAIVLAARWSSSATRSIPITRMLMRSMLYLAYVLPPEAAPTLPFAHQFLLDEGLRQKCCKRLPDPLARYWRDLKLEGPAAAPLDNTMSSLMGSDGVRAALGRPEPTYTARQALREGMIVLASAGDDVNNNLGSMLLNDMLAAVRAQGEVTDKTKRRALWVLLDEAQMYDDGELIPMIFRQLRKFGGRSMVLTQSPSSLHANTLDAIATNASYLSTTAQSKDGAKWFAGQWGTSLGGLDGALQNWERFRYLSQGTLGGRRQPQPFTVEGLSLEQAWRDQKATPEVELEIRDAMRRRFLKHKVADTLVALDEHPQTVASALSGSAVRNASPNVPRDFFNDPDNGGGLTLV